MFWSVYSPQVSMSGTMDHLCCRLQFPDTLRDLLCSTYPGGGEEEARVSARANIPEHFQGKCDTKKCQTHVDGKLPRSTGGVASRGLTFTDVPEGHVTDGRRLGQGDDQMSLATRKAPTVSWMQRRLFLRGGKCPDWTCLEVARF